MGSLYPPDWTDAFGLLRTKIKIIFKILELELSDAIKYSKIYYIKLPNPVIMRNRSPPPSLSFS